MPHRRASLRSALPPSIVMGSPLLALLPLCMRAFCAWLPPPPPPPLPLPMLRQWLLLLPEYCCCLPKHSMKWPSLETVRAGSCGGAARAACVGCDCTRLCHACVRAMPTC